MPRIESTTNVVSPSVSVRGTPYTRTFTGFVTKGRSSFASSPVHTRTRD